jgi:hypothetical protein
MTGDGLYERQMLQNQAIPLGVIVRNIAGDRRLRKSWLDSSVHGFSPRRNTSTGSASS